MALTLSQQFYESIEKANDILICFKKDAGGDAIGSSLALAIFLEKMGKRVDIISSNFELNSIFKFLPRIDRVRSGLNNLRQFIINLNIEKTKVNEFSYDLVDNRLKIFITPESGFFNKNDLTTESSDFRYNLIIVIDTPDLESLGEIYQDNTEFFYKTTIINIDHDPANEHFGQINLIDLNTTSSAEIIFELMQKINSQLIDDQIATALLTGMIHETKSFKTDNITPQTLSLAGQLINLGADREKIIAHLYRTKTINILKLWGRALARLKNDKYNQFVWTLINKDDFIKAGANEENLSGVIDELITSSPEAKIILLLYESADNKIKAIVHTAKNIDALLLSKPFDPKGNRNWARFELSNQEIISAEREVTETFQRRLERMAK